MNILKSFRQLGFRLDWSSLRPQSGQLDGPVQDVPPDDQM